MSQYIIQTRDLTKTYGEQKSVSNLNMHVRKGKIYVPYVFLIEI